MSVKEGESRERIGGTESGARPCIEDTLHATVHVHCTLLSQAHTQVNVHFPIHFHHAKCLHKTTSTTTGHSKECSATCMPAVVSTHWCPVGATK